MLGLFNRFLTRMRSAHPILGNRNLLIMILDYLEGEDLFQMVQVNFSIRTTVQSMPYLEISLLKFSMKKSNECIDRLRVTSNQSSLAYKFPQRSLSTLPFMHIKRKNFQQTPPPKPENSSNKTVVDPTEEKWVQFVDYFHYYARNKGFNILKRKDFDNEQEWNAYKMKFTMFYYNYVDHIRTLRNNKPVEKKFVSHMPNVRKLLDRINMRFHYYTDYRYFTRKTDTNKKPTYPLEFI